MPETVSTEGLLGFKGVGLRVGFWAFEFMVLGFRTFEVGELGE